MAGVAHLWLVDPEARTLEAFELKNGASLKDDESVAVPPFAAVSFPLGSLWWPR